MKSVTHKDIAEACGVSRSTVTRVLQGHPNVSSKNREKSMKLLRSWAIGLIQQWVS